MIACLPMYDRPALRWATDQLWEAIATGLKNRGIDAPESLSRDADYTRMWNNPDLLLGMTCGKPYRDGLHHNRVLVGNYDYGLEGCPPGFYNSHIIANASADLACLAECAGLRFCYNGDNSESGFACVRRIVGDLDVFCGAQMVSGGHQTSVEMVVAGEADFAAIDASAWRYILADDSELASRVKVIDSTDPVPGLPFITAHGDLVEPLAEAAVEALASAPEAAAALNIVGFVKIGHDDFCAVT